MSKRAELLIELYDALIESAQVAATRSLEEGVDHTQAAALGLSAAEQTTCAHVIAAVLEELGHDLFTEDYALPPSTGGMVS